jgi:hypothetical protein
VAMVADSLNGGRLSPRATATNKNLVVRLSRHMGSLAWCKQNTAMARSTNAVRQRNDGEVAKKISSWTVGVV